MRSWMTGAAIGALVGFFTIGAGSLAWSANNSASPAERAGRTLTQIELFAEVFARVQADYVTEIDEAEAIEAALNGMLNSLDPHSSYMPEDDFRSMEVRTSGEYTGLGIEVSMQDGFVKVVAPIDDTPAARADIESGDLITAINGQPIVGRTLSEAVRDMRGESGQSITLSILRPGRDETFDVTLVRDTIRPKSAIGRMEGNDIGYLRISAFNKQTTDMLRAAITDIKRQSGGKLKGIVLDLRNNPGGLLDQAVSVSDLFLSGGEVVSTRGRRPGDVQSHFARNGEEFKDIPMVVLINGGSASAAEIVAGALQDRERAKVLGVTSFGKGSVQTILPLGTERGALSITTSRYYTPSGRSIQNTGIEPDIEVAARRFTEEEIEKIRFLGEASLPNALSNEEGTQRRAPHIPDDQPPEGYTGTDYQLDKALAYLRGL